MKNKLKKKGIETLEDVRFWLAVLRKFDKFSDTQKEEIGKAYNIINEVCKSFKPKPKPKPEPAYYPPSD